MRLIVCTYEGLWGGKIPEIPVIFLILIRFLILVDFFRKKSKVFIKRKFHNFFRRILRIFCRCSGILFLFVSLFLLVKYFLSSVLSERIRLITDFLNRVDASSIGRLCTLPIITGLPAFVLLFYFIRKKNNFKQLPISLHPVERKQVSLIFQFRVKADHIPLIREYPAKPPSNRFPAFLPLLFPLPPLLGSFFPILRILNSFSKLCGFRNTVFSHCSVGKNTGLHIVIEAYTVLGIGEQSLLSAAEPHIRNLQKTLRKNRNSQLLDSRVQKTMIHILIK